MVSGRPGLDLEQLGVAYKSIPQDFPRSREIGESFRATQQDDHKEIGVCPEVWSRHKSPYPKTDHGHSSECLGGIVFSQIPGTDGIPDPIDPSSELTASHGGGPEL